MPGVILNPKAVPKWSLIKNIDESNSLIIICLKTIHKPHDWEVSWFKHFQSLQSNGLK